MGKRELLDCTLRDGGYINDWAFGHDKIIEIFERLASSGVEYIEIGFLDERRKFDINRTIFPDTDSVDKIFFGVDKGEAVVLAMIDYGTCGIERLRPADESFIDGIRVIFKEHLMYDALVFCQKVKELGYKVFAQLVSVTTYTDEKLKIYAEEANKVNPYATSMVDTYGLLDDEQLIHIFAVLDKYLLPEIKVGYHAHNNFQLGYANARAFLQQKSVRDLLADGTLYGMGKSAGNAPIELLMLFANEKFGAQYALGQALSSIDNTILDIYRKQSWGYNMFFFMAAATKCHPNYVSWLMNKKTLSVKQIMEILSGFAAEKKLLYDAKYVEKVYVDYQSIECDDGKAFDELRNIFADRDILLLGPGRNIKRQNGKTASYIAERRPVVISVNYAPSEIKVDYIFLTKSKRYRELKSDLKNGINCDSTIIATSNVTKIKGKFRYVLNYGSLIDESTEIIDNSLVMLLKAMIMAGVKNVALAGFDGYSKRTDNYFDVNREYTFVKEKADYLNRYVKNFLVSTKDKLQVYFVTKSYYAEKS